MVKPQLWIPSPLYEHRKAFPLSVQEASGFDKPEFDPWWMSSASLFVPCDSHPPSLPGSLTKVIVLFYIFFKQLLPSSGPCKHNFWC